MSHFNYFFAMLKNAYICLFLLFIFFLTSCLSTKNVEMFQDMKKKSYLQHQVNNEPPEYIIKVYDNLFLSILTLDPQVNNILNPQQLGENTGSGTEQAFGSAVGQYINGYRVGLDSAISVPILGDIKVAGLPLKAAEAKVKTKAEEYLQSPNIQVKLLNFKVNILGEVNTPGIYYHYEGSLTIFDAIGNAQGTTSFADLKNVIINRQTGTLTNTYKIDLTQSKIYNSDFFYLQPNDMVYIPPTNLSVRSENRNTFALVLTTISSILLIATFFK